MKRRILALLAAGCLVTGLAGAAAVQAEEIAEEAVETVSGAESTDSEAEEETVSKDIKVWVSEETKAFTEEKIKDFLEGNDALEDYTVTVEAVNELDAPKKMRADVENGADIYTFPQDELATLVAAEALTPAGDTSGWVIEQNDEGAVNAATIADTIYAYPMTADNGYFLYYDKSVILDTSTLEGILADCEGAGKTFYFELTGGWYQTAFFFATGCDAVYGTDLNGKFTSANFTYASDEGLEALKGLIALSNSPAFRNGSSIKDAKDCAAIVDGTWDSAAAKEYFGDNYACSMLPSFGVDGIDYQMSGFGGFKLLGIKPQTDPERLAAIRAIAQYLTGTDVQLARFLAVGWGPSNKAAQDSEEVQADPAISALTDQLSFSIPQTQYPTAFWDQCESLGELILSGALNDSSDDDLRGVLQDFQDNCAAMAQ